MYRCVLQYPSRKRQGNSQYRYRATAYLHLSRYRYKQLSQTSSVDVENWRHVQYAYGVQLLALRQPGSVKVRQPGVVPVVAFWGEHDICQQALTSQISGTSHHP